MHPVVRVLLYGLFHAELPRKPPPQLAALTIYTTRTPAPRQRDGR